VQLRDYTWMRLHETDKRPVGGDIVSGLGKRRHRSRYAFSIVPEQFIRSRSTLYQFLVSKFYSMAGAESGADTPDAR